MQKSNNPVDMIGAKYLVLGILFFVGAYAFFDLKSNNVSVWLPAGAAILGLYVTYTRLIDSKETEPQFPQMGPVPYQPQTYYTPGPVGEPVRKTTPPPPRQPQQYPQQYQPQQPPQYQQQYPPQQ